MSALGELHDMATSHHRATSATPFKMSANYYLVIARYINQAQHLPDRHKVMFTSTGLSGTEWELLCLEMMPENIPWIRGEWRDDLETIRGLSQKVPTVSEVSTLDTGRDELITHITHCLEPEVFNTAYAQTLLLHGMLFLLKKQ